MVMVDMAATNAANGWQRNIAFVKCMSANNYAFISPYLAQTGLTIELTPFRQDSYTSIGTGYSDRAYDNMMHHFLWGALDKPSPDNKPYLDEVNRDMLAYMRLAMLDLTDRLIKEGDVAKEAAANPSAFPLLPQRVRSEAFAADRYAKARDILMLKESKLPEFVALSNYEFYRRTADAYYHLWRATGNAADRRKADATISAAIDRFSQHMVYFQTLTFWQPMSPGNRLIYNDGGFSASSRRMPTAIPTPHAARLPTWSAAVWTSGRLWSATSTLCAEKSLHRLVNHAFGITHTRRRALSAPTILRNTPLC